MEFFKSTPRVPFMRLRRGCYLISVVLVVGSAVLLGVRGLNFGIDFTGGVVLEVAYPKPVDLEQARAAVAAAGFTDGQVQQIGTEGNELLVRVPPQEQDAGVIGARIVEGLRTIDPGVELRRTDIVGPQVGAELAEQGGLAMIFCFLMILVYVGFRFEKKMAAGTVIAAMHDPFVILGFFALTQLTFDLATLAAILAVIGYSINDTVVVFDRVRDQFQIMRKGTPTEVIDAAINQTLSRTLMTSFSTLFVVISLYLFGGETLKSFSIAIIVGVAIGTYSSIFVAGALAHDMKLSAKDLMPPQKEKDEIDALP